MSECGDLGFGQTLPDCILLHLFGYLNDVVDLCRTGLVCKNWYRVSCDEFLWRNLFCKQWHLPKTTMLPSGKSWKSEYMRICYETPTVETDILRSHKDQVLHVNFSHDGLLFSTCSKDSHIKVWNTNHPITLRYDFDMSIFKWKYTQFSQFNESDTLLLVSGVLFRSHSTSGEIAVFSVKNNFELQSRIQNKPYDIFGAWYSENYLISGSIKWLAEAVSSSILWLNSAYQEIEREDKSVIKQLYRFYNSNASSVRTVMVANCIELDSENKSYDVDYYDEMSSEENSEEGEVETLDDREKYLIFTTGSKAYTPHEIGFKRMKPIQFQRKISLDLKERLAERREQENATGRRSPNWLDEQVIVNMFDNIDCRIDLNGQIIGMALSPDHRYLYVNSRPWPNGAKIENPYEPPPLAQEIDIHVIDMTSLIEVGTILRSHKAFTPTEECFFIFLNVSNNYVASGAEDKFGYLWDRHYSILISKLGHSDVVNSVAFNPKDEGMLVSASDDFTIKVWRSKKFVKTKSSK